MQSARVALALSYVALSILPDTAAGQAVGSVISG